MKNPQRFKTKARNSFRPGGNECTMALVYARMEVAQGI
jgi:hypothetical protein